MLLILFSLVLASPIQSVQNEGSSVPMSKAFAYSHDTRLAHLARVKAKYSKEPNVLAAALKKAPVILADESDIEWTANVTLADGSTFTMDLDTGSSDTWIIGNWCVTGLNDTSCDNPKINWSNLSTYHLTPTYKAFYTQYGIGAIAGDVVIGDMTMGGLTSNLAIGVGQIALSMGGSSGLMGLAFESISDINNMTGLKANWFDNLGFTGDKARFGFYLNNQVDGDQGEITIGGVNSKKYKEPVHWIPLNSNSWWQFSLIGWTYSVNGLSGPLGNATTAAQGGQNTIADTGTTLIDLAYEAGMAINTAIGAYIGSDGYYYLDCAKNATGPVVSFVSPDGTHFNIVASTYVLPNGDGTCISGFQADGDTQPIWGDIFLRNYYSIYDKGGSQLGFAQAIHP